MSNKLQDIFIDYDPSYGGAFYACPDCGELKYVAFRCKSRFCPTCGNMYNLQRSFSISCKLISCVHRHCVFTIPEELRPYFLDNRKLLSCLFHSVRDVIFRMFYKVNKSENFTPGFILVLHTFGRDLKWNPHIHALISDGGTGNNSIWRPVIATSRIDKYDGDFVTFHYTRHEDDKTVTECIPALNFIKRLIVHISEKHFYVGVRSVLKKKLHYLNNIERSWDMAEAMLIIVFQSSNSADQTKQKTS